jgi:hypothetical protein
MDINGNVNLYIHINFGSGRTLKESNKHNLLDIEY